MRGACGYCVLHRDLSEVVIHYEVQPVPPTEVADESGESETCHGSLPGSYGA
jgi:hypothetical protein